jgi:hypothetical protein
MPRFIRDYWLYWTIGAGIAVIYMLVTISNMPSQQPIQAVREQPTIFQPTASPPTPVPTAIADPWAIISPVSLPLYDQPGSKGTRIPGAQVPAGISCPVTGHSGSEIAWVQVKCPGQEAWWLNLVSLISQGRDLSERPQLYNGGK